jgi:multicomponent Na+:H+ antiporter subunit D
LKDYKTDIFERFESKFLTVIFGISFLSILGIPPFSGFVGKILILEGFAKIHNYFAIAFILAVSIIEAVYFFRLISMMVKANTQRSVVKIGISNKVILSIMTFLILLFGVYPALLTHFTDIASNALLNPEHYLQFALGVLK